MKYLLALWLVVAAPTGMAASIEGQWIPPGGDAIIEISLHETAHLTLVRSLDISAGDDNNPDPALRARPLAGILLGSGFSAKGSENNDEWKGGTLYDPGSGKTYKGQLRLIDEDHLELRGYIGIAAFGRSEIWTRRSLFERDISRMLDMECAP